MSGKDSTGGVGPTSFGAVVAGTGFAGLYARHVPARLLVFRRTRPHL